MSSAAADRKRALYEAFLAVPAGKRAEIVGGTLYVLPRPAPKHANAASVLGGELSGAFQRGKGGPGGWWILFEPELHLVDLEPMVPDIAGWRVERLPELPDTAHFSVAPNWVCEVLSRSTEAVDRNEKLPIYAAAGVEHAWLVDPVAQTLEVHTDLVEGKWRQVRVYHAHESVRAQPFEAIEIELAALWSPPKRNP
jgi:Uma2 family endonuclease